MNSVFVYTLLLCSISCNLISQVVDANCQLMPVWTNMCRIDDESFQLFLRKEPFQIKGTFSGELADPARGIFTITNSGDMLELTAVQQTKEQSKITPKTIWRHFHAIPMYVAPEAAIVEVAPVLKSKRLALLVSDGYLIPPHIYLIDPEIEAAAVADIVQFTNKDQLKFKEARPNENSIDLADFQNWNRRYTDKLGLISAMQSGNITTLILTNSENKRFKFEYSDAEGQWHAYSSWGEINRVK